MLILSIDSSDIYCRIGIGNFIHTKPQFSSDSQNLPYKQAEHLLPMIKNFMNEKNINKNQLTAIAVACGPGSFSGIRIALATARSLGLVLNIPVLGYDNFSLWYDSIQQNHNIENNATLLIVLQSKRQDLYVCAYQNQKYNLIPQTAYPEDIKIFIKNQNHKIYLTGNMNDELLALIKSPEADKLTLLPEQDFNFENIALKANQDINKHKMPEAEPVYLRMPQTSTAKKIWKTNDAQ